MKLQPRSIQINISNACNSRCPGCPITFAQRKTDDSISETAFASIIDSSIAFIGEYPLQLQFGIGNTLLVYSSLVKYVNVLSNYKNLCSNNPTLEFSVTLLSADDKHLLNQLVEHINNVIPNANIIVECIISPTIDIHDFNIVEENISFLKSIKVRLHIICRFTNGLNMVGHSFINMVDDSIPISLLTVDFFFKDQSVGSKYTYVDFENWCMTTYKNYLLNYPFNPDIYSESNSSPLDFIGLYFDNNLIAFPLITTPFGDMILPDPINSQPLTSSVLALSKIKRLSFPSPNPICQNCNCFNICPSQAINSMHDFMGSPITSSSCYFGKKILAFIQAES